MKKLITPLICAALLSSCCHCRKHATVDTYLDDIRDNTASLYAFFSAMPKGGDLHNHFTGSVYAETYISYVVQRNYFIDTVMLTVDSVVNIPAHAGREKYFLRFSALDSMKILPVFKQKLIQKWSVKDYNGVSYPSDKQFFETFGGFGIANNNVSRLAVGLQELKDRAKKENVSYIETMFTSIPADSVKYKDSTLNKRLLAAEASHDTAQALQIMEGYFTQAGETGRTQAADSFVKTLNMLHTSLAIDDSAFTMRYQAYVTRVVQPADVLKNLVVCFHTASMSPLVVGVNIVAPENDETSMRDYWLHMLMFKFCHTKYPKVKYSMHAGELTLGMVKPEELIWHINQAVRVAGANRIGHGVDLPYEHKCYDLLKYMADSSRAIEINLYSNEFILKVKEDAHPFLMYKEHKVPVVISTDDAGVLRSNLIHQYVLLAQRYKEVSYQDIKKYVYNSITYSFIEEDSVKTKLKAQLDKRFADFERDIMANH